MAKVLFLDIDGVLNSHQWTRVLVRQTKPGGILDFCPISCSNLMEILARHPDLQIVISSTWRIGHRTLDTLREELKPTGLDMSRIVGMTPVLDRYRGTEIKAYCDANGLDPEVDTLIILDDNSDMKPLMHCLIQTDGRMGLMWDKAVKILIRLGDDPKTIDYGWC